MLTNFNNEDFERFLKQSADHLRMRPSENVWKKIDQDLRKRKRRVLLTSAFFLVTISVFGYYLIDSAQNIPEPLYTNTDLKKPAAKSTIQTTPTSGTLPAPPARVTPTTHTGKGLRQMAATTHPIASGIDLLNRAFTQQSTATPSIEGASPTPEANTFTPTIVDAHSPLPDEADQQPAKKEQTASLFEHEPLWSIESVVNSYKPRVKKRKTEFQLSFTPTISYRKLSENKSYLRSMPPSSFVGTASALYSVNSVVTHKPDIGLELGFNFKYPITKGIKLRSGLQFNINRYDIKAFTYTPEVATIALNSGSRVDSLATVSKLRNFNGNGPDWLQNMYFQVSAPVGVELKLKGNEDMQFGVATTIQPTYVLGDRAYLISSDYKHYSQVPWLIRRWNVNYTLETFVSYTTGQLKWQVGPQMRYQLLSSFVTQYPVKENLFDFGFKVGVSFNQQHHR